MKKFFSPTFDNFRAMSIFCMMLLAYAGVFQIGTCLPLDNSSSLYYGAATGKGQVVQPVKTTQTQSVKSAPVTTTRTTLLEVAPLPQSKTQLTAVPSPTAAPVPAKHHEPVCIDPYTLGIPTVQNCADLKIMGQALDTVVSLQPGLENCELMDDTSCDNGSGEGFRAYQARLSKAGGVALQTNPGVGPCLSVDKKPDGRLEIKTALGWASSILCCRPICIATTTTTTTTTTILTTTPSEALLPLREEEPTPPSYRPQPATLPQPAAVPQPTPLPIYTTPAPTFPGPMPFAELSAQIPIVTTPAPTIRAAFGEMCVMPRFLDLPRVSTCEDVRDLALSTAYIDLVNIRAAECAWVDDVTCGPAYPGLGAYLEGGIPDDACLAYRQTTCGNVVGPYPILGKHLKDVCRRPAIASKSTTNNMTMMPVMMMPMPSKGKGARRLDDNNMESDFVKEVEVRRLHGKHAPVKGGAVSGSSSDSVVLCCRLQCSGVVRSRSSLAAASAVATTGGAGSLFQLMPSPAVGAGASLEMRGFAGENRLTAAVARTESDLCQPRYWRVCSMATPLAGERIVFDQRCLSENLPGCNAGAMPCCRSVSFTGY